MFFGSVKSPAGFHGLQPPKGKQRWLLTNGHGSFTLFLLVDLWRPGWTSLLAYLCGFFCFVLGCVHVDWIALEVFRIRLDKIISNLVWPHNLITLWIEVHLQTSWDPFQPDLFYYYYFAKKSIFLFLYWYSLNPSQS